MLTGRPLFPEGRTAQKLVWQQIKQPVPVDRLRPEVPAALATVIHCMLEKKPADRFLTPLKVFEALAHFVTDEIPLPNPLWLPEPPARVALARLAVPNATAPRLSGSTSKIVAAAMRTGSGSTSSSVIPRKDESNIDTASDSDKLTLNPVKLPFAPLPSPTVDMAADDTQRNPKSSPTPHPTTPIQPTTGSVLSPTVVIFALAISLVLALLGIIILLLR
jgi:serine/threonine-protein kinase